jgi:hypothetical protein
MSEETTNPEKKLYVDEDWKSQVEAEKAAEKAAACQAEEPKQPNGGRPSAARGPLPPANFTFLVSTLYLQGAIALGLLPNPVSDKSEVRLEQAKHSIDLLTMLQQKTRGNLAPDESEELEAALHQLRLAFVGVQGG